MAKGNTIVLQSEPKGVFKEGIANGACKAGICVQIDADGAVVGGRHTYEPFNAGADGLAIPLVAGKCFLLTSESDGDIDINITLSSGAATYYLVLVMPDGSLKVSGAITFAA